MAEHSKSTPQFDEAQELHTQISWWKYLIPVAAALLAVAYIFYFRDLPPTNDPDKWGTFGDYFGGIMNPIVAFAAFYWLTQSVKLQKKELAETKAALVESAAAQNQLVENGRLAMRLSALTALVNATNDEIAVALQDLAAYKKKDRQVLPHENSAQSQENYRQALSAYRQSLMEARKRRFDYLAEMREILESTGSIKADSARPLQ